MGFNLHNLKGLLDTKTKGSQGSGGSGIIDLLNKLPLDKIIQKLPLEKLLTPEFMQKYTSFKSVGEMLQKMGLGSNNDSATQVMLVPKDKMDNQLSQNTQFSSLQQMLQKAAEFYASRKAGNK
ncbi:hypothetical protein [Paenibacillus shenyangensis]|uniref:hypothetical protein n=1 Tax=Paenibacillus sp. A9 TaxID=1284352 RepID=UPI00036ECAFA|nr:hypothetical protein [Paenibacillus sp. A9]